ncbi:MAG: hypothetical protein IJD37_05330, partial [Clostridia bacterium]|nr:hypothetical protein [Clostridia bacterium]
ILLNEDGTPKVFYHGTGKKFTAFDIGEIASREGSFFFAENREDAEAYGKHVMPVYVTGKKMAAYDNQPSEFYHLKDKNEQVKWLKERKYDGWYADMDSDGWGEVSVFSPEQIKSAENNIGTFNKHDVDTQFSVPTEAIVERKERIYGNSIPERTRKLRQEYADGKIGFDELVAGETKLMEEAREKYGTIEEGENPQERVKVPQGVEKNKNVSQYVRTILETGVVSEALAAEIGEKTLLGEFSHKVLTDEKALEDADKAIKNGTARNKWGKTAVDIHRIPTKNEIAVGEKLLEKAMKDGKTTEYNFKKLFLKNRKSFFCSYFKT